MQYHVNSNSFQNHSLHILCVRTKSWVHLQQREGREKKKKWGGGEERRGDHQQGPTLYILSQNIPRQ